LFLLAVLSSRPNEIEEAANSFETWSPRHLLYKKDDSITKKIKDFYYNGSNTENITVGAKGDATSRMISDRIFNYGLYIFAKVHKRNAPLFLYYNNFISEFSSAKRFPPNQTLRKFYSFKGSWYR